MNDPGTPDLAFQFDAKKPRVYQLRSRKPKKRERRWTVAYGRMVFCRAKTWKEAMDAANHLRNPR